MTRSEENTMNNKHTRLWLISVCVILSLPFHTRAQNVNASLSGTVTDPSGAVVPDAELTLTAVGTGVATKIVAGPDGLYSFPNLLAGAYDLKVSAKGFRDFVQRGIKLTL